MNLLISWLENLYVIKNCFSKFSSNFFYNSYYNINICILLNHILYSRKQSQSFYCIPHVSNFLSSCLYLLLSAKFTFPQLLIFEFSFNPPNAYLDPHLFIIPNIFYSPVPRLAISIQTFPCQNLAIKYEKIFKVHILFLLVYIRFLTFTINAQFFDFSFPTSIKTSPRVLDIQKIPNLPYY